uniref:Lipase member N n=1 Tax=Lygus hesperus TaxID=30085 RepID=A0A0A9XMF3_LYGHE
MLSERPEYNDKVHIAILLMPVGDMPVLSTRSLGTRIFFNFVLNLMEYYKIVGSEALFLDETNFRLHILRLCENAPHLFAWTLGMSSGPGLSMDINYICPQAALQHGGTSMRTCLHTIQLFRKGEFRQLERGAKENQRVYGTSEPPLYNYTKITTPLAIYYSDLDEYSPGHVVRKMFPKFGGTLYSCLLEKNHHTEPLVGMLFGDMYNSQILEVLDSATGRAGATKEKLHSKTCQ